MSLSLSPLPHAYTSKICLITTFTKFWILTFIFFGFQYNWYLICFMRLWWDRTEREFSDYKKMGIHLNQFMGSSSSIGAKRVRNVCVAFRAASEQNNRAGWVRFPSLCLCFRTYHFFKQPPLLSLPPVEEELRASEWQIIESITLPRGYFTIWDFGLQVFKSFGAARTWVLLPQKQIARTVPSMRIKLFSFLIRFTHYFLNLFFRRISST